MFIIYTKHDCPWCDKAKSLLENFGCTYEEKHFNVDFTKEELIEMLGESIRPTVPQVYIMTHDGDQSTRIGGYEDLVNHLGILE